MCKLTVETQEKTLAYWHVGISAFPLGDLFLS